MSSGSISPSRCESASFVSAVFPATNRFTRSVIVADPYRWRSVPFFGSFARIVSRPAGARPCSASGKATAFDNARAGNTEVLIDHENLLRRSAELSRLGDQGVLARGRFAIVLDLCRQRR
jgi:hypothetical protein